MADRAVCRRGWTRAHPRGYLATYTDPAGTTLYVMDQSEDVPGG